MMHTSCCIPLRLIVQHGMPMAEDATSWPTRNTQLLQQPLQIRKPAAINTLAGVLVVQHSMPVAEHAAIRCLQQHFNTKAAAAVVAPTCVLVVQHSMPVAEGASLHILPTQPYMVALRQQRGKCQRLSSSPVNLLACNITYSMSCYMTCLDEDPCDMPGT
jgi:hypothetical protein